MIQFGRDICGNLAAAERREWLVTNGIGGFASGTLAGTLTRRYHGLLLAALQPPAGRTLLVSKLDETVTYNEHSYPLFMNRWAGGVVEPNGFQQLERFRLEGTTPVWCFAIADALLEKKIWMQQGANISYVQYYLRRASKPMKLVAQAQVNYRDFHGETHAAGWQMRVDSVPSGVQVVAYDGATTFYLLSDRAQATPKNEWFRRYFLLREANRGFDAVEDHLHAAEFEVTLQPDETVTFVLSTEVTTALDGTAAYVERRAYEEGLVTKTGDLFARQPFHSALQQLLLAADQFVVKRPLATNPDGQSIIAGYPWFGDWGRDTMIALPGLTLVTKRPQIAAKILRTFAHYVDRGMLPNRFPDVGRAVEYNTADATLWYFEAIRAYYKNTQDKQLVRELFPVLQDIIAWHRQGTRYNIKMDAGDGLIFAGVSGQQLTWMDAKVDNWVVTPRIGKPVEINALWFNALQSMVLFATLIGENGTPYAQMAEKTEQGFQRFWDEERGYCLDVLDSMDEQGNLFDDGRLRPNQIFAVSLCHSPLSAAQQKAVVDICGRFLLTSHGLRSLAPHDPAYIGSYGGNQRQRDGAYHQGTVWGWLIGPYVEAHLRVYQDKEAARSFLIPFIQHIADHGVGSLSEIFDGDPPFQPRGCIAQAWSVAELLRAYQLVQ